MFQSRHVYPGCLNNDPEVRVLVPIEIIDLFAGPGGLGEGFSQLKRDGKCLFKIGVSIEKEKFAHETLLLRSFFRQFETAPDQYYEYLRNEISKADLFEAFPQEHSIAEKEAWCAELGHDDFAHKDVIKRIRNSIKKPSNSIVIGGPPCQAYSLIGRSKMGKNDSFEQDPRHTLYKEYLKIISEFKPAIFVMENVKGIISSKLDGEYIFDKILEDLRRPCLILNPARKRFRLNETYTVYSLSSEKSLSELTRKDYTIRCEDFGIPQRRHRVILVAVRNDLQGKPFSLKKTPNEVTLEEVIGDLPKLRSGLSKFPDEKSAWRSQILAGLPNAKVYKTLNRGAEYINAKAQPKTYYDWFHDPKLLGVVNHTTRSHISEDLHRYYYASSFAIKNNRSPRLQDFPENLLPKHKNIRKAIKGKSLFNDRFRVQLKNRAATTITSHISKDGHYFIHYDPRQCRSLTVREAARIQTFPDNYKFEGPRTAQYQQVGNAVPPLLAHEISKVVYELLEENFLTDYKRGVSQ